MAHIKNLKLKVTAQYQDEQIRVSGKNRDDLQKVIASLQRHGVRAAAAVRELSLGSDRAQRCIRQPRLREESRGYRGDDRETRGRRLAAGIATPRAPIRSSSTRAPSSIRRRKNRPKSSSSTPRVKRRGQQLIVAGCLAQRYGAQLQSLVPEIDGVVGTGAYAGIVESARRRRGRDAKPVRLHLEAEPEHDFLPRLVTTPRATAYLKIAEGCDHPCTFCIIPELRGEVPEPQPGIDSSRGRTRS